VIDYRRIPINTHNKIDSFFRSINAQIIQSYLDQEGRLTYGFFFAMLRPLLITLTISLVLRGFRGNLNIDEAIQMYLFPASIFFLIRELVSSSTHLDNRKNFLYLPNVNYFSMVLSNCLSKFFIYSPIFFVCIGAASYFDFSYSFFQFMKIILLSFILGCLYQYIASLIMFESKIFITFHSYFPLTLLFTSCVFFPLSSIPIEYQKYFLYSPIVHLIESVRFIFSGDMQPGVSLSYVYSFIFWFGITIFPTYWVKTTLILRRSI
jgi:capsular polysaccharide transport system permease protein